MNIRKLLLNQQMYAWAFFLLCIFMSVLFLINHKNHIDYQRQLISINEKTDIEIINTPLQNSTETRRNIIKFYNKIISSYGYRYSKKNPKAMPPAMQAKFVTRMEEYTRILEIPRFAPIIIAMFETSFNPYGEGTIGEKGIFQKHWSSVGQSMQFLAQLKAWNPRIGSILDFKYLGQEDLHDPLNALKMVCVDLWGLKRHYKNDPIWYISAYHWGSFRIEPFYRADVLPPEEWIFNKGTLKEDVRQPFHYYFMWDRANVNFERGRLELGIPWNYIEQYRKIASADEMLYLKRLRFQKKLISKIEDLKEIEIKRRKRIAEIEKMTAQTYKEYLEVQGMIKKGKFKNIKTMWAISSSIWKKYIDDVTEEKKSKTTKYVLYASGVSIVVFWLLGVVFFGYSVFYLKKKLKKSKEITKTSTWVTPFGKIKKEENKSE